MKKILLSLVTTTILFTGCNNVAQPNTPVKFYTPAKLSVIKKGSKIYVKNLHNSQYKSKQLLTGIKDYFKKDNIFKIVNNIKDADVVISLNNFYSYAKDTLSQKAYNIKYYKKTNIYRDSKGRETGGQDVLLNTNFASSTATLITTVSIYDKKHLEPLVYFNITPTDTSKTPSLVNTANSAAFNKKFTQEVINKLNDLVTTKNKNANVFLPKNVNKTLKSDLLSANFTQLFKDTKEILPKFDIEEVSVAKYDSISKEASKKGSKIKKRDLESDLSNFYIYLMAKEATDISAKNIKKVYNGYKKIMNLTSDESLILACANSLGRLEFKANRLKINLGDL